MKSRERPEVRGGDSEDRAAAPILGLVLLFAMVILGAMLVFVAAGPLFDALQSESERERAVTYMSQTDQSLATATISDDPQPLEVPPDADLSVVEDGELEVSWYNDSEDPWDSGCTAPTDASGTIGALEYELDDRTIVHQGGGVWEQTADHTRVISEPDIAYTNASDDETGSLQLRIMQLDESDIDGSGVVAKADHSKSTALTDEIQATESDCGGSNVAFRIEDSSYHEGWAAFLEDALGDDENPEVEIIHHDDDGTVEAIIEGIREPIETPTFIVEEDKGIGIAGEQGKPQQSYDYRLDNDDNRVFYVETVLRNEGDEQDKQDVTVTIFNESGTLLSTSESSGELDPGQGTTLGGPNELKFNHGDFRGVLEVGNVYEYSIETEDDELDEPGSFYYGESGTALEIDDVDTNEVDGNVTITADMSNIGVDNATDDNVTLDLLNETNTQEIDVDYGAEGTVEWEVNKSAIPIGEHEFTITTDEDGSEVNGTIEGDATGGDGTAFVVVGDEGVGDDQFVTDDRESFTVSAEVANTYPTAVKRDVTLSIPDADVNISEPKELENGTSDTVDFEIDPDKHDFDHGEVYEYNVQAEGDGLDPNGSFYFGHSDTQFELANGNATLDDENVTLTADLHNTGVVNGTGDDAQNITVDLETDDLPDDLDEDPYAETIDAGTADRAAGENATIELPINRSVLVTGTYDATIATEDDELEMTFDVDAGIDPGDVELGNVEDAEVAVEVLGSQVSGDREDYHQLSPMTLEIVTGDETEHEFENPEGGDNINIGPWWQDKGHESYQYEFEVDEETELTLRNTRYESEETEWVFPGIPVQNPVCDDEITPSSELPHYTGPGSDFAWCNNVPDEVAFGPIDASEDANLQSVRVRSNKNNTIPALPAGTEQQLSATEVLEQHDLVEGGDDELDLGPGEFVFLFENTISCDHPDVDCDEDDGIDALWNDAINAYEENPDETYDPNFNDLIVYVEVEQAGVDPGKPSITISPGSGEEADADPGDGGEAGTPGDVDLELGGDADPGDSPDIGTGDSEQSGAPGGQVVDDTGIDIDSDYIVVG